VTVGLEVTAAAAPELWKRSSAPTLPHPSDKPEATTSLSPTNPRYTRSGPCDSSTTLGVRSRNLAGALAVLLVSCGGSGDALAPGAGNLVADLRVSVKPEGPDGPERVRRVECAILGEEAIDPRCRVLGGLEPRDLDPVPRRTACAQVYGGPGTARVTGELHGVRVAAEFDLSDACEIARWRRNAALLGAPGVGHGAP
jgi:hypothetical protein